MIHAALIVEVLRDAGFGTRVYPQHVKVFLNRNVSVSEVERVLAEKFDEIQFNIVGWAGMVYVRE